MSKIVQEKMEVRLPPRDDDEHGWVSDKSARVKKGTPGREGLPGGDPASKHINNDVFYNTLPPGMEIEDQELTDQHPVSVVTSGESDVSRDWNAEAARQGFTRRRIRPTDDMWTKEHQDLFYDEITVDGVTGFLERGNTLDRL